MSEFHFHMICFVIEGFQGCWLIKSYLFFSPIDLVLGAAAVLSGRGYKHDEVKAKMMDLASKGVVKSKGKDSPNRLLHLDTFRDVDL